MPGAGENLHHFGFSTEQTVFSDTSLEYLKILKKDFKDNGEVCETVLLALQLPYKG